MVACYCAWRCVSSGLVMRAFDNLRHQWKLDTTADFWQIGDLTARGL